MPKIRDIIIRYPKLLLCIISGVVFSLCVIDIYSWTGACIQGHSSESYCFYNLFTDMKVYLTHARGILNGTWPTEPYFRAPLYSYLLAAALFIKDSILWVVILQLLFAILTVIATYMTGNLLFNKPTGFIAGLLLVFYGGYTYFISIPHTAVMEVFFATASLYAAVRFHKSFHIGNAVLCGVFSALLCLIRPNYLIICMPVGGAICLQYLLNNHKDLKKVIIVGLITISSYFLVLSPFLIWNNLKSEKWVLFCTNSTNYPTANSYDSVVFNYVHPKKPQMPLNSAAFWKHQLKKSIAFWKNIEYPQNVNYTLYRDNSLLLSLLPINFSIIGSLFIAASFFYLSRWRKLWPIYAYAWLYTITIIAFFIIGRFRLPAVPAMLIMGTSFLLDIFNYFAYKDFKGKKLKEIMIPALSILLFITALINSAPWWHSVYTFNSWSTLSRQCFLSLNLPGYIATQQKLTSEQKDIPLKNIVATALIVNNKAIADESFVKLKGNNIPLSSEFIKEFYLLSLVNQKKQPLRAWVHYLKTTPNPAHIGQLYRAYLEAVKLRDKHNLRVPEKAKQRLLQYNSVK